MFVCLSVGYTLLIKPNSIHMLYMGRSGRVRVRVPIGKGKGKVPIEKLTHSQPRFSVYERKRNSHIFLPRFSFKSASDFSFLLCLSNVACKRYPKSANRLSDVWQFNYNERYP